MGFLPPVLAAAYLGGLVPGLLATAIGALAATYFFVEPPYSLRIASVPDAFGLALFVLVGVMFSGVSEALHRTRLRVIASERRRAEQSLRESEELFRQLADNIQEIFWIQEGGWERLLYISPAYEHAWGRSCQSLYAQPRSWIEDVAQEDRALIYNQLEQQARGIATETEFRVVRRDGSVRWMRCRSFPVWRRDGDARRTAGLVEDVTERRRTQQAALEAQSRLELAIRSAHIGIWEYEAPDGDLEQGQTNWINLWEMFGYAPDEFPTTAAATMALVHPDDRDRLERLLRANFARETRDFNSEHRIRRRDGSYRWVLIRAQTTWDEDGRSIRQAGVLLDISDLKAAAEALRESEERFRDTFENAAVGIALKDLTGRFLRVNQTFCDIVGYTRNELLTKTWPEITDPADKEVCLEHYSRLVKGECLTFTLEKRYLCKDRSTVWVELSVSLQRDQAGLPAYAIAMVQDISQRRRLDACLRRANERLELALTSSRVALWEREILPGLQTGPAEWVNFWEQWGRGRVEDYLTSEAVMELVHPSDREPLVHQIEAALRGDAAEFTSTHRLQHRDGTYHWALIQGTIQRDAHGQPVRWSGCAIDITDLKRAELALRQSEERFRGTFDYAAVGIAHIDAESRCLRANPKMCEILGYTSKELIGKTVPEVTHHDDLPHNLFLFGALMRGEIPAFSMEKRFLHRNGSIVWTYLTVSLQRDEEGKPAYAIVMVQDISELKRLENELRDAKDSAEAANRAKDEFLANVSHEIRTPMNAILGMTELALDTPLADDQKEYLKTVQLAADSLLGILNDLLDFSKIEAGKLELDPADFALREMLGDTLRTLATRAHKKGLELISNMEADAPDALIGDATRVRQVLLNLIGNAIKFTESGEVVVHVEVAALPAPDEQVWLRFTVSDTGVGIPPDKQETIFRAFEQQDPSTTRKYGGTGLGLTIAARLVAMMGGSISVQSEPDRGSTFAFTARFGLQPHPPAPVADKPPAALDELPVLIVDDNATNRSILQQWLRGWHMQPAAVSNGLAALDALWHAATAGGPYPLLLLDAHMPDTDGLTLAATIRDRSELAATRIILLSSAHHSGAVDRIGELRIDAQLLKPLQQGELLETIYRVMSRTSADPAMADRQTPAPDGAAAITPSVATLQILVAEDNEFNAQLLRQLLIRRGHRVRVATNGREALSLTQVGVFDLLLLDLHMPELDGFQVVRAVREREQTSGRHLPVIALTARSRLEDRRRCLAAGMDEFLSKPVRSAELWAAIDRVSVVRPTIREWPSTLLNARVLWDVCGGDAGVLNRICVAFQARVPDHLSMVREALEGQDTLRLREAAHKLNGMLAAYSEVAGNVASKLEEYAVSGQLYGAGPLVEQLEAMARELMRLAGDLSIEKLRQQAELAQEPAPSASH
jgi:PAS domain S-box-containing protein